MKSTSREKAMFSRLTIMRGISLAMTILSIIMLIHTTFEDYSLLSAVFSLLWILLLVWNSISLVHWWSNARPVSITINNNK